MAVLNIVGVKGGIGRLKNDIHLAAFPNAHCFTAGTPALTETGLRPIEEVEKDEWVWSFNLLTGQWELCRVVETYSRDHDGTLVKVFVAGGAIESTYHHPYWVVEGQDLAERPEPDHVRAATVRDAIVPGRWVDAGDLRIDDVLLLQDGGRLPITEIILRQATCRVYNLAVEGLRNYAVGLNSVLAHNMCGVAVRVRAELPPTNAAASNHHAIPHNNRIFNHEANDLVRATGVNLQHYAGNQRNLINHAGRHEPAYHQAVQSRMNAAWAELNTAQFKTLPAAQQQTLARARLDAVIDGVFTDVGNASLWVNSRPVWLP